MLSPGEGENFDTPLDRNGLGKSPTNPGSHGEETPKRKKKTQRQNNFEITSTQCDTKECRRLHFQHICY